MLSFSGSSCKNRFLLEISLSVVGRNREEDLKQQQYLGMALVCRSNQPVLKPISGKHFGPKKQEEH